jgi:hypothetical protein
MPPDTAGEDWIGWGEWICHATVPVTPERASNAEAVPVRDGLPRNIGQSSASAGAPESDSSMTCKTAESISFFIDDLSLPYYKIRRRHSSTSLCLYCINCLKYRKGEKQDLKVFEVCAIIDM